MSFLGSIGMLFSSNAEILVQILQSERDFSCSCFLLKYIFVAFVALNEHNVFKFNETH